MYDVLMREQSLKILIYCTRNHWNIKQMREESRTEWKSGGCENCEQQESTIQNYLKLITLYKKKVTKYQCSKSKDLTMNSSPSEITSSNFNMQTTFSQNIENIQENAFVRKDCTKIILLLIDNRIKKSILQQGFRALQHWSKVQKDANVASSQSKSITGGLKNSDKNLINQILKMGKAMHQQSKNTWMSQSIKGLEQKIFSMKINQMKLMKQIETMKEEYESKTIRQDKQLFKKRESFDMLLEELSQKNQLIEEMKSTIKWHEIKGKTKIMNILNENEEDLKKTIFRLENINDKINLDIEKFKSQKIILEGESQKNIKTMEQLKQQNRLFKEQNFDLQNKIEDFFKLKDELELKMKHYNVKMERLIKSEKKCNEIMRSKTRLSRNESKMSNDQSQNILDLKSEKRVTQTTQNLIAFQKSASIKDNDLEHKLDAILNYIFNIEDQNSCLLNKDLFQSDELELLECHKLKYIHHQENREIIKSKRHLEISQIIQLPQQQTNTFDFNDSILNMFDAPKVLESQIMEEKNKMVIKMMNLEMDKTKLVQKISEVKDKQMHLRSVVLNLLKSLELRNLKNEAESIMNILFELLEYSETEKQQVFQIKQKKLFGFI